jgi:hypothetical protein
MELNVLLKEKRLMQYDADQLNKELVALRERRELFMAQVNQLHGAVAIVEQMLATLTTPSLEKALEEHEKNPKPEPEPEEPCEHEPLATEEVTE